MMDTSDRFYAVSDITQLAKNNPCSACSAFFNTKNTKISEHIDYKQLTILLVPLFNVPYFTNTYKSIS